MGLKARGYPMYIGIKKTEFGSDGNFRYFWGLRITWHWGWTTWFTYDRKPDKVKWQLWLTSKHPMD